MTDCLLNCILFARRSALDNFAREFQGRETRLESGYLTTGLLVILGIVAAVWVLMQVVDRLDGRRSVDSSLMLFLALCRAHRLRWSEWWLLWLVARDQKLKEPARLFLEPELLDPANLGPVLRLKAAQLEGVSGRLFAGVPDKETPRADPSGFAAGGDGILPASSGSTGDTPVPSDSQRPVLPTSHPPVPPSSQCQTH